jgi:hypothetical protein
MTAAFEAPATWRPVGGGLRARRGGADRVAGLASGAGRAAGFQNGADSARFQNGADPAAGLQNGALKDRIDGGSGLQNGAVKDQIDGVSELGDRADRGRGRVPDWRGDADPRDHVPRPLESAVVGFGEHVDGAVRRGARALHAACAELLPGYTAATREPWRQSLLTGGCLDPYPPRAPTRRSAPPLVVEDVVQPSDVLCALWLARRCGLFSPGSPCGDGVGLRSACDIVPSFAPALAQERRAEVLDTLRANSAWRAHLLARAGAVASTSTAAI